MAARNLPYNYGTILITLLFALVFQLYPWSSNGVPLRPDFLLVVVVYWLLRAPNLCNIGIAWATGMLVDLSTGSLLGQHGLSFALTAYLGLIYQRRLVLFNKTQLLFYVFSMFVCERLIVLILKVFADNELPGWGYVLPIVSNLLLWQLMTLYFGDITRSRQH